MEIKRLPWNISMSSVVFFSLHTFFFPCRSIMGCRLFSLFQLQRSGLYSPRLFSPRNKAWLRRCWLLESFEFPSILLSSFYASLLPVSTHGGHIGTGPVCVTSVTTNLRYELPNPMPCPDVLEFVFVVGMELPYQATPYFW